MPCTRGYDQLFAEKQSGKHGTARPEFTRALVALRPGDTLVFWKSDRWGRSAAHVLTTIGELRGRGVTVKSLTENFDLDTQGGPVHVRRPGRCRRIRARLTAIPGQTRNAYSQLGGSGVAQVCAMVSDAVSGTGGAAAAPPEVSVTASCW
jgi:hypothetical protein